MWKEQLDSLGWALSWDQRRIHGFDIAPGTAPCPPVPLVVELGPADQRPLALWWERAARNRFFWFFMQHPKARLRPVCRWPMRDAAGCISSLLPQISSAELEASCGWAAPVAPPGFGDTGQCRHRVLPMPCPSAELPVQTSASIPLLHSPSCAASAARHPPPSYADGPALPQAPNNPGGSQSFPLGCWGTPADAQHRGLDQKGRASHPAPIARSSTPSHGGSHWEWQSGSFLGNLASPSRQRGLALPAPLPAKLPPRPGATFTFLPRAHLSAELSAAPVIGPRRSLVLGVNTAESEKTRAEPSPGASSKAAKHQHARGAQPPPRLPIAPCSKPQKTPGEGCSAAVPGIAGVRGCGLLLPEGNTGGLGLKNKWFGGTGAGAWDGWGQPWPGAARGHKVVEPQVGDFEQKPGPSFGWRKRIFLFFFFS